MTITIPRRLRENQPRSAIEAAERLPLDVIDRDPRTATLLQRRAAAAAKHRQDVESRNSRRELIEQAKQRLAQAGAELERLEAAYPTLARRFALGEAVDADLTAHRRALEGWQRKGEALRTGIAALDQEANDALRHGRPFADAVSALDAEIESTRALVALELARRAA